MGVPKLFKYLATHYSRIISTLSDHSTIEWFGIDFNSLMHPVCANIAALNESVNYKKREHWPILYKAILDYLVQIIQKLNPGLKTVYIAIDGVVPVAKMLQQRQRRFRSATERYRKNTNWDSCLISPGTFFMRQFESYFTKHQTRLEMECGVKIVISNSREFGEGEHKIMKEIRSLPSETPIAIYGLDADLILLGISVIPSHPNLYLVRENVHCSIREFKQEEFLYVNIKTLWNILQGEIQTMVEQHQCHIKSQGIEPSVFTLEPQRLIYDFLLLSCYFGNDFLPAIPATSLSLNDSIQFVVSNYSQVLAEEGNYMVQSVTDSVFYWNTSFLLKFWTQCQKEENKRMSLRTIQWLRRRRAHPDDPPPSPLDPLTLFYSLPRNTSAWMRHSLSHSKSYLSVFSFKDPYIRYESSDVQCRMVQEWLRGSIWVLSYYTGIKVDPYWFYPWLAPPCFEMLMREYHDVIQSTTQIDNIELFLSNYRRKRAPIPHLHLQFLIIIPPDSEYCIPTKQLGWLSKSHPRHIYTPSYHDIGKKLQYSIIWASRPHECVPMMPLLELPHIIQSLM